MPEPKRDIEPRLTPVEGDQHPEHSEDQPETRPTEEDLHLQWEALRDKQVERETRLAEKKKIFEEEPRDEDGSLRWTVKELDHQSIEVDQRWGRKDYEGSLRLLKIVVQGAQKFLETAKTETVLAREDEKAWRRSRDQIAEETQGCEESLDELERLSFVRSLFVNRTKRLLRRKLDDLRLREQTIREQWLKKSKTAERMETDGHYVNELLQSSGIALGRKKMDYARIIIDEEVKTIGDDYQHFFDMIERHSPLLEEIIDRVIQGAVIPEIKEWNEQGKTPPIDEERFIELLSLEMRGRCFEAELRELDAMTVGDLRWRSQRLTRQGIPEIPKKILGQIASRDMTAVQKFARNVLHSEWEPELPRHLWSRGFRRLSFYSDLGNLPNVELWFGLRESPIAQRIFGPTLAEFDDQYYELYLKDSLRDFNGDDIDKLPYFPRPQTVAQLAILGAAEIQPRRAAHALFALGRLQEQSQWDELWDETKKQFPELEDLPICTMNRDVLDVHINAFRAIHRKLRAAVAPLALAVFNDPRQDLNYRQLALEVLPTPTLLKIAERSSVISHDEAENVQMAEDLLSRLDGKDRYVQSLLDMIQLWLLRATKNAMNSDPDAIRDTRLSTRRLALLCGEIHKDESQSWFQYFRELAKDSNHYFDPSTPDEKADLLLRAPDACPKFLTNQELREKFFQHFQGAQTVEMFRAILKAFPHPPNAIDFIDLIIQGRLTLDRVVELGASAPDIVRWRDGLYAKHAPDFFLATNEGVELFRALRDRGVGAISKEMDVAAGERLLKRDRESSQNLVSKICESERRLADTRVEAEEVTEISDEDWIPLFLNFIHEGEMEYDAEVLKKIHTMFESPEAKEYCWNAIQALWREDLRAPDPHRVSLRLSLLADAVHREGAGPMSHLEALLNYIYAYRTLLARSTTAHRTKKEVCRSLGEIEDRFDRERWSREDRAQFYNITGDLMIAAPSLVSETLRVCQRFTPSQMKRFSEEIYPLLRARLAIVEESGQREDEKKHPVRALAAMRRKIREFGTRVVHEENEGMGEFRATLIQEIKEKFKEKFGIIRVPDHFDPDQIHALTNVSIYLANLNDRTPERETLLGFYLALMLNGQWQAFRSGTEINPDEFLVPEKSTAVKAMLEQRTAHAVLTPERLGLEMESFSAFQSECQQEIQSQVIGEVETVDVKLSNVLINLEGLSDLDLYPDPLDKDRMRLVLDHGTKRVGAVVAKMYKEAERSGRSISYAEEERAVHEAILELLKTHGLEQTPQKIKAVFQDGMRPFSVIVNVLQFAKEVKARDEIETLRGLLTPGGEVAAVFNRLGEEFKPTSGAMALTQDLNYLDNLVVKREKDLQPEERELLKDYIQRIRHQLRVCEGIYDQVQKKVGSLKTSQLHTSNPLLAAKLKEIEKIVRAETTQTAITTTLTNDLNRIIENIRECLSCQNQGANNDTNLTFGDANKFFLYSRTEHQEQKGSVSDQIVYLEPVTVEGQPSEMAFVFDRLYGSQTPSVAMNHLETVLKKVRQLRAQFPNVTISVVVPDLVFPGGGVSEADFRKKGLTEGANGIEISTGSMTVDIAPSAAGDHYLEFGTGEARSHGPRQVHGLILRFRPKEKLPDR